MISKLIINADDFGLTSAVTEAIIDAHVNGIVSSTTMMGNCEDKWLSEAQEVARRYPDLGIGVHLVLTTGCSILKQHKTITDELGRFILKGSFIDHHIDEDEVYMEWRAQIERIAAFVPITHFDSHHHIHLHPQLQSISKRLSREFKLPMRWNKARKYQYVYCAQGFYNEHATISDLQDIIHKHHGLVDIMVHPGLQEDVFLEEISSYTSKRYEEYLILTSEAMKSFIADHDIELVNYRYVKK